jgi:hypothetical protein
MPTEASFTTCWVVGRSLLSGIVNAEYVDVRILGLRVLEQRRRVEFLQVGNVEEYLVCSLKSSSRLATAPANKPSYLIATSLDDQRSETAPHCPLGSSCNNDYSVSRMVDVELLGCGGLHVWSHIWSR